jgi:hypothetical protein
LRGLLACFELDDEALSGSYRERKITLRQAKRPARFCNRGPKLLCIFDYHLTDREDIMALAMAKDEILPLGMILGYSAIFHIQTYRSG